MNLYVLSALAAAVCALVLSPLAARGQAPAVSPAQPARSARDDRAAESLGWQLGLQAWTFRDRTAFEAIETAARLGLRYIELYPGQPLSPENPSAEVGPGLSGEQVDALKRKLESAGVKAVSYGVVGMKNDEAEARGHFEFARAMGLRTLVAEPMPEARDLTSRLADEYGQIVAIHNHPRPSIYWNPETVLEALRGRSTRLGACADTGHWPRSGLRATECLRTLEGRIVELHFKDVSKGLDTVWGTGDADAPGMLAELKRQGFRGQVYVEYEVGRGKELEENVARCIEFFDNQARALAARGDDAPPAGTAPR